MVHVTKQNNYAIGHLELWQVFLFSLLALNFFNEVQGKKTITDVIQDTVDKDESGEKFADEVSNVIFDYDLRSQVLMCCEVTYANDQELLNTCKEVLPRYLEKSPRFNSYYVAKFSGAQKIIDKGSLGGQFSGGFMVVTIEKYKRKAELLKVKYILNLGQECKDNSAVLTRDSFAGDVLLFSNLVVTLIFPLYPKISELSDYFYVENDLSKIKATLAFGPLYLQSSVFGPIENFSDLETIIDKPNNIEKINSKAFQSFINILSMNLNRTRKICAPSIIMRMFDEKYLRQLLETFVNEKNPAMSKTGGVQNQPSTSTTESQNGNEEDKKLEQEAEKELTLLQQIYSRIDRLVTESCITNSNLDSLLKLI